MDERRPTGRWVPWVVVFVMAIIVAAAVFAYLDPESLETSNDGGSPRAAEVQEGIACPPLEKVRATLAEIDSGEIRDKQSEFRQAVKAAEREAIKALDRTGISFGRAEVVALRIAADVEDEDEALAIIEQIRERLTSAQGFCDENAS